MHYSPAGQITRQLALAIQLNDEATLADFCWNGNALLQEQIHAVLSGNGERLFYLWGNTGSGKSHLLQGLCQGISSTSQSAIYLPLRLLKEWGPGILEGINEQALIAIDDIDAIAADEAWEEALFHLYNQVRDEGQSTLIISGQMSPLHVPISLADLRSRLVWGLPIQLNELSDEDKIIIIQLNAKKRGFELPTSVGQFLINRCSRNMHELHTLLDSLDKASLEAQRKISIPFAKGILGI